MNMNEAAERSAQIRQLYHQLGRQHHGQEWTVEEDALAFLTDAGLVGRLTLTQQGRWPVQGNTWTELEHRLGEYAWWLMVLAERMVFDFAVALERENLLA